MHFHLNRVPSQTGRLAIVTGANVGLGYETALALAGKGMEVILACRNMEKAGKAKEKILRKFPGSKLSSMELDLSKLASVRSFAEALLSRHDQLDLLINNAGIMIPPFSLTEDGFESQFGTNYIGHFLLTALLFPQIEKTDGSRIVSLSSLAHRSGQINLDDLHHKDDYKPWVSYSQSKLACLMFCYELQRRLEKGGRRTLSVAAHPGFSATSLGRNFPFWLQIFSPLIALALTQSAKAGAEPTLYAALGEDIVGGDYCGPSGKKERKGKAVKVRSARRAQDEDVAGRLWEETEKMVGMSFLS